MKVLTYVRQKRGKTAEAINHIVHLAKMDYMQDGVKRIYIQVICKHISSGKIIAEAMKEKLNLSDGYVHIKYLVAESSLGEEYNKIDKSNDTGIFIFVRRIEDVKLEDLKGSDYTLVDDSRRF